MDLVTDREYINYDLVFDWKINKEGEIAASLSMCRKRPDIPATYASGRNIRSWRFRMSTTPIQ